MNYIQAAVLGFVQGLTEFLPISSTGHLVLANYYFGWGNSLPLYIDIATNIGTFLAVLAVLHKDIWQAFTGFLSGLRSAKGRKSEGWHLAILIIIGTIPTVFIGLGLKEIFEVINQPLYVSVALIATGFILWFVPKSGPKSKAKDLTVIDALITGAVQGLAVIPGISRSGSTIATLLWRSASANLAPKISFLMYVVASLGVSLLGVKEFKDVELELIPLLIMIVTSFITGYLALLWLLSLPTSWKISLVCTLPLGFRSSDFNQSYLI